MIIKKFLVTIDARAVSGKNDRPIRTSCKVKSISAEAASKFIKYTVIIVQLAQLPKELERCQVFVCKLSFLSIHERQIDTEILNKIKDNFMVLDWKFVMITTVTL